MATDTSWFSIPPIDAVNLASPGYVYSSQYVTMSDNCKIAVDTYLPPDYFGDKKQKYPTILHFTRYNRCWKVKWPFSLLLGERYNVRTSGFIERFVTAPASPDYSDPTYVWVTVDVRGTGASYGTRYVDFSEREVEDFQEVLAWVIQQQWCNGVVGSAGVSYDGMIAARLAAGDQNNYVKAISLLFSPIDVYKDTIFPGGLPCTGFMNHYREFTYYGERNKTVHHVPMPLLLRVMNLVLLDGAAPVDDDKYCVQLNEAIKEHEMNWDMNETLKDIACYDDIVTASNGRKYTADKVGVTTEVINNISKNNVAVYSFAGYYDSGSIRSATRVFCGVSRRDGTDDNNKSTNPADTVGIPSVGNSRNKLTIGPWNHGARNNGSSYSSTTVPAYDTMYDLKRFFDAHLCNIHENNGILDEPPVHYFELGSESWVTSDRWPVAPEEWIEFSMNINGQLTFSEEEVENIKELLTHEVYDVQSSGNITTGMYSRWNLVQQIMHQPFDFIQNDNRLTFTSSPINSFIRLVGAPRIRLSLRPTDGTDVAVFVYLLTVDPQGKVHYVTEGMTRGYHGNKGIITSQKVSARRTVRTRNSSKGKNMISDRLRKISELPLKSNFDCTFRKKDGSYLDNNHYNMIDIHLEPVSCLLVPGTSMRVAICGCDHDNFDLSRLKNNLATSWELQYSNQVQSNNGCVLALPIASSQAIKQ